MGIGTLVTSTASLSEFKSLIYGGIIFVYCSDELKFCRCGNSIIDLRPCRIFRRIIPGLLLWKAYKAQQNV